MSMPSGKHVVAAKSGINYSLQFFTVRCAILQHRMPLSCPASLHSCRCCSMLRKWWWEDKSKTSMSMNSMDVLNTIVSSKPQALVHLTPDWGARKKFCSFEVTMCVRCCTGKQQKWRRPITSVTSSPHTNMSNGILIYMTSFRNCFL